MLLTKEELNAIETAFGNGKLSRQSAARLIYTARVLLSQASPVRPGSTDAQAPPIIEVFTDDSCLNNPGPDGWACLIRTNGEERTISGGVANTTSPQMELLAVVQALRAIKGMEGAVVITSDSKFVVLGASEWLEGWKANGWLTSKGQKVKHQERWQELDYLAKGRLITWKWVQGHSGHVENGICDRLARAEAAKLAEDKAIVGIRKALHHRPGRTNQTGGPGTVTSFLVPATN